MHNPQVFHCSRHPQNYCYENMNDDENILSFSMPLVCQIVDVCCRFYLFWSVYYNLQKYYHALHAMRLLFTHQHAKWR